MKIKPGMLTNNPHLRHQARGAKMNRYQKFTMVVGAFKQIVEGKSKPEVREFIYKYYKGLNLNTKQISNVFDEAMKRLKEINSQDNELTVKVHLAKYEKIWAYFKEVKEYKGQRAAMRAKEKLIGMHKAAVTVRQTKTTNKITISEVKYDLSRLNDQEQSRFKELLNKASR